MVTRRVLLGAGALTAGLAGGGALAFAYGGAIARAGRSLHPNSAQWSPPASAISNMPKQAKAFPCSWFMGRAAASTKHCFLLDASRNRGTA